MDTFLTLSNVSKADSVLNTEPAGALIGISTTAELGINKWSLTKLGWLVARYL